LTADHSRIRDGRSRRVRLLFSREDEPVSLVKGDRTGVLLGHPQLHRVVTYIGVQQSLARPGSMVGIKDVERVELTHSRFSVPVLGRFTRPGRMSCIGHREADQLTSHFSYVNAPPPLRLGQYARPQLNPAPRMVIGEETSGQEMLVGLLPGTNMDLGNPCRVLISRPPDLQELGNDAGPSTSMVPLMAT